VGLRYERDEIKPSIDTAAKVADALGVTLVYLVRDAEYQNIDQDALDRLKLIESCHRTNVHTCSPLWMHSLLKTSYRHS
jgi:transcriptional regulator with XRE-family HTH domain